MDGIHQEVINRLYGLLGVNSKDISLHISTGYCFDLIVQSASKRGDIAIEKLFDSRERLLEARRLANFAHAYLQACGKKRLELNLDDIQEDLKFKTSVKETPGAYMTSPVEQDLIKLLIPLAYGIKASVFIIDYDGTYLDYFDAGHPGKTIVSYEKMIGQKAMNFLPEGMRELVKSNHEQAISTNEPQEYFYPSPLTGRWMRSLAVPYPDYNVVALFVMEGSPALVPV